MSVNACMTAVEGQHEEHGTTPYHQYIADLPNALGVDFPARLVLTPKASYTFPVYADLRERLDALYAEQNDALTHFTFLMDQLVFSKGAAAAAAPGKLQSIASRLRAVQTSIASVENARLELNRVGEYAKAPEKHVMVTEKLDKLFRSSSASSGNQDYMHSVSEFHAWCVEQFGHRPYFTSFLETPPVRGPPKIVKSSSHKGGGTRYQSIKSRILSAYKK